MRYLLPMLLLMACSSSPETMDAPPDLTEASTDLAGSDIKPENPTPDAAQQPTADLAHPVVDMATTPADLAQCGHAGEPCCGSNQFDPAYCQDSRAGASCTGTCGSAEVCRRDFTTTAFGVPTCYPCGATGDRCCAGNACDPGRTCKVAGSGVYNLACAP
jgi:hypothetical protein